MAMIANKQKPRELIKAGRYKGVLVGIYDLGHRDGQYGPYWQVVFLYELHNRKTNAAIKDKEGNPVLKAAFHDMVLEKGKKRDPSPLALHLGALLNKTVNEASFQLDDSLLEKALELTIEHKTKDGVTRDDIGTVLALEDDDEAPKAESDATYYEIPRDESSTAAIKPCTDDAIPDGVPEWIRKQIRSSLEFGGKPKGKAKADDDGDEDEGDGEIPF